MGLHLTAAGQALMVEAEQTASALEIEATGRLSAAAGPSGQDRDGGTATARRLGLTPA